MCWLGTFVFGANAIGLTLYAGQLALGLNPEAMDSPDIKRKDDVPSKEDDREQWGAVWYKHDVIIEFYYGMY